MVPPKNKQKKKENVPSTSTQPANPTNLSEKEIEAIINSMQKPEARGKFGEVFIVSGEKPLAVKRTSKANRLAFQQYQKEEATLRKLNPEKHENVIELLGSYENKDYGYLFMEYCPKSLQEAIKGEQLQVMEIKAIVIGLAQALQVLHKKGSAHCDIKPQNIMLDKANKVKLIDFGAATDFGRNVEVGTEGYYKKDEKEATGNRDTYAFGITLLQLLRFQTEAVNVIGKSTQSIKEYAQQNLKGSKYIAPKLLRENESLAEELGNLAIECTDDTPSKRPNMKGILNTLSGGKKSK